MLDHSRPRKRSLVKVCALLSLVLLLLNCGDQDMSLDPFPRSSTGGVLTGTLHAGDNDVADATVRLEPVINGMALSVAELIDQTAIDQSTGEKAGAPGLASGYISEIRVTVSDSDGRYAFDGLDAGDYLIVTNAKDHLAGSAQAEISSAAAAAAETTYVDIALVPTGTFTGNATLQNATDHSSTVVYVKGSSNVAVTDATGDYQLSGVPVGDHTIQATHPGWLDQSTAGSLTAAGDSIGLESLILLREANIAPVAAILPLPTYPVPNIYEPIAFEATASDLDGTIELIEWDFEDDGIFDFSDPSSLTTSWAVPDTGSYRAKVRVTDDKGAIGLAVLQYQVYDAIYVWGEEGSDMNPGTTSEPVQTIQQGITLAELAGLPVIVHAGSYWENIEFKSHVSVWGGYSSESGWTRPPASYSEIWLQSYYNEFALADGVVNATIRGLEIEAESAQGDASSAIALKIISCDSTLNFNDCRFIAGGGTAAFTAAADGGDGLAGGPGNPGENGCDADEATCSGRRTGGIGGIGGVPGGNGGDGGWYLVIIDYFELYNGEPGGGPYGGAGGQSSHICTAIAGNGGNALANGQNGNYGQNATPIGPSSGTILGNGWVGDTGAPGDSGQNGQAGSGGGGGGCLGSLYNCHIYGASGGGGGGAGGGGQGGDGGNYGGASIAVLCINSTVIFDSCFVQTGNGGNGWRGGDGGLGAPGSSGAPGGTGYIVTPGRSGDGGDGSDGGSGGDGGGGQGGPGGPSIGIYIFGGVSPAFIDMTWSIGSGGTGGPGGWHSNGVTQADAGPVGPSEQTHTHP